MNSNAHFRNKQLAGVDTNGCENGLSFQIDAAQTKGKANGTETVRDNNDITLLAAMLATNVTVPIIHCITDSSNFATGITT